LLEGQQLELVNGELINKMGKNRRHVTTLMKLVARMFRVFGEEVVNSETPIDVAPEDNPTNEPQPDLVVLKRPSAEFLTSPKPADLQLVVEISDSTLHFDLTVKATLYARAGIIEYWVVDTNARRIIVHRDPQDGVYRSVVVYGADEKLSPLAAPGAELTVGEVIA